MNVRKSDKLRTWIVGTAATGLLWHSLPAIGNAEPPVSSNKKKAIAKVVTAESSTKSTTSIMPARDKSKKATIQLTSQNVSSDGKTEVQRQLEALYQQDGREMPDMNFNLQPLTPGTVPGGAPQQQMANPSPAVPATGNQGQRPGQATTKPVRPAQGYTQYQPKPPATPYPAPSAAQPVQTPGSTANPSATKPRQTVFGMLKKVTSGNRQSPSTTEPPIPPDFNTGVPVATATTPMYGTNYAPTPQKIQPPSRYPEPARLNAQSARPLIPASQPTSKTVTASSTPNQATGMVQSVAGISSISTPPAQLQQPAQLPPLQPVQLPPLSQDPLPINVATVPKSLPALPPLSTEPQAAVGRASVKREKVNSAPVGTTTDFPNPFTEVNEAAADSRPVSSAKVAVATPSKPIPAVVSKPKIVVAPKIEVAIPVPTEPVNIESTEPAQIVSSDDVGDPYAVEAKDFVEPYVAEKDGTTFDPTAPSLEPLTPPETPMPDEPKAIVEEVNPIIERKPEEDAKPSEEPKPSDAPIANVDAGETDSKTEVATESQNPDKMQKIRDRFGMKGLKGFCLVTLRDQRELVDAKPEFHVTHRRQKFHFASAEARDKFEANPVRYKPAAYGADVVVLSRDEQVVEGTLDYAAWYKGRLFLFSSQENYEIFVKDPTQFATIEEFQ